MRHLHPGSNYQHLKTCLDWATVILDSLTVQLDRRKGGGPGTKNILTLIILRFFLTVLLYGVLAALKNLTVPGANDLSYIT